MRAPKFLAFIAVASGCFTGCFTGLDDGKLTGGAASGPPDLARQASDGGSGLSCDDFANDAVGTQPPDWTAVSGSWKVVDLGNGLRALGQTKTETSRVLAWMGTAVFDLALSATVRPGGTTATDCLVARYHDEMNYYGWCISKGTTWELIVLKDGKSSTLDSGGLTYDTTMPHALVFSVKGSQLAGSVDGIQLSSHSDTTFGHGGVALATDSKSSFAQVCVTPL
jgi:hypothetical protein